MNKRIIFILLIAAIAITMFSMTSFAYGRGNFAGQFNTRLYQNGEPRGIFNLDLSEEQITEIREMTLSFQKDTLELRNQIEMKQLELREIMLASPIDMLEARAKLEEIASLQVEMGVKAIENQEKVKELLTPEQLESFGLGFQMPRFDMGSFDFNQDFQGFSQGFKRNRW